MLKRLVICLPAICLLAIAPAAYEARADVLQDAIARLTPEQQSRLKAYEAAHIAFAHRADQYWRLIELKRRKRKAKFAAGLDVTPADYVAEQPPVTKALPGPMTS